ncbi:hypothetical protein R4227_01460 [Gordonia amicalis]|uniref:hypothetical protein n=1 Tax=Gordonia amicalis TaxID=89053 RepID=UPI002954C3DC|nr:hypothetical protein [Gordonia amicalis]MDV7098840.1 hypothetical protein [Gordonia amicalis]
MNSDKLGRLSGSGILPHIACCLDAGEGLPSWLFMTVVYPMFAVPLVLLVLALFLVVNTAVVVRRERLSLSTLAPAAIGVLIVMTLVSLVIQLVALVCSAGLVGRLVFLLPPVAASPGVVLIFELVAYTVYAFVYSRIRTEDVADVVVVLGSGLNPVMIVSGGKGSDERRSEAEAMAEYV